MNEISIPILTYHNVTEKESKSVYEISLAKFKNHMGWFQEQGFTAISLGDLKNWICDGKEIPAKPIILTFDDGYANCYNLILPILKAHGFKAVFFLTTAWIEKENYLTWEQILRMKKNGMELGSHGHMHRPLTALPPEDARYELKISKFMLEKRLNESIDFLSIPGGFFNSRVKQIAKEVGYKAVLTSKLGINNEGSDIYALYRIGVRSYYSQIDLEKLINNKQVFNYKMDLLARGILKKSLGQAKYSKVRQWILERHCLNRSACGNS